MLVASLRSFRTGKHLMLQHFWNAQCLNCNICAEYQHAQQLLCSIDQNFIANSLRKLCATSAFALTDAPKRRRKVAVAVSGGVDSAVAACLMKRQGYVNFTESWSLPYQRSWNQSQHGSQNIDVILTKRQRLPISWFSTNQSSVNQRHRQSKVDTSEAGATFVFLTRCNDSLSQLCCRHEVFGIFMRNWDEAEEKGGQNCSAEADYQDAERVCRHIGIPLHEVDFISEYWNQVFVPFLDMVSHLSSGLTPLLKVMPKTNIVAIDFTSLYIQRVPVFVRNQLLPSDGELPHWRKLDSDLVIDFKEPFELGSETGMAWMLCCLADEEGSDP